MKIAIYLPYHLSIKRLIYSHIHIYDQQMNISIMLFREGKRKKRGIERHTVKERTGKHRIRKRHTEKAQTNRGRKRNKYRS